jgi:hypothetical protein
MKSREQKKAKNKLKRKTNEAKKRAFMMAPEICGGCELPLSAKQSYRHPWCM